MPGKSQAQLAEELRQLRQQLDESERARAEQAEALRRAEQRIRELTAAGEAEIQRTETLTKTKSSLPAASEILRQTWILVSEFGSDIIFHFSSDGKIIAASTAASEFFGFGRKTLERKNLYDLVVENDRELLITRLRAGKTVPREPLVLHCTQAQGTLQEVEFLVRRVASAGHGGAWVGLARPRGTPLETPAPEGGLPAGQLTWTSGLAHELNQPLTAIGTAARACLRLLRPGKGGQAELREALERIARQADRAGEIIRRLRDLVTAGKRYAETVDLNGLIRESLQLLHDDLRQAGVTVQEQFDPHLPLMKLDRIQISQVLVNLARNAVEAMQEAPAPERVLTVATRREGEEVEVSVTDRGVGLTVETVARLFEPFQTSKPQGMGVGLALSRRIVQAHGGRIEARPNADRGATFTFSLPLGKEKP